MSNKQVIDLVIPEGYEAVDIKIQIKPTKCHHTVPVAEEKKTKIKVNASQKTNPPPLSEYLYHD